ncbi:MCE family protein [Mycolicibacterium sp. CBMA 226]|uniref:MCE family protein n=1 Tax=Mycolicibacterium sp. CBMA 226 TaxID=2606611 RepID=UPI0012DF20F6|nr:MCE family protein [Mycolicibacterium sp. CBMA 226]MUL74526.1 MCE family protein [Mycolicibacterium sp. CBMA 226]
MRSRHLRVGLSLTLVLLLVGGGIFTFRHFETTDRTHIVAYFDNSNGLFVGDEVRILGVPVGAIDTIEPQAKRVKVAFWIDRQYKVPADAKAVIVSPQLVTARAIQLTPAFENGPQLADGATIPQDRTAVPLEWDDLRNQLEKLTDALQPSRPQGVSTLGAFVNTAANNLRGQGANIRHTIIELSQALSALGDHSGDMFSTIKNLSVVVSALDDSSTLLAHLNQNLASVTGLLTNDSGAVGTAISDLNAVVTDTTNFVRENREALGTATDRLASISSTVNENLDGIKQALHVFPTAASDFANVYQPSQDSLSGILALNNFADPLKLICGSIAAAGRLNGGYSSKLCMQYLAPIVKNRQINFLPVGANPIVGESARPNELTYSEDRLRPDFVPPHPDSAPSERAPDPAAYIGDTPPEAAATDPAAGLSGLMVPAKGGS